LTDFVFVCWSALQLDVYALAAPYALTQAKIRKLGELIRGSENAPVTASRGFQAGNRGDSGDLAGSEGVILGSEAGDFL